MDINAEEMEKSGADRVMIISLEKDPSGAYGYCVTEWFRGFDVPLSASIWTGKEKATKKYFYGRGNALEGLSFGDTP